MHSELAADQDRCVRLHETFGDPELLKCATLHRDIVVKFGRFPHGIRAMGRDTTPAEQEFFGRWRVRGVVLCGFPRPQGAISAAIPRSLFQARSK
jgi:hypothetical protein